MAPSTSTNAPNGLTSTDSTRSQPQALRQHSIYFIHSADLHFLIGNVQYKVHRYFFERESAYFRGTLALPASPGAVKLGSSDDPIVLEDVASEAFDKLLWVFYNPRYSLYDAPVDDYISILVLAHKWGFAQVKAFAVRELQKSHLSDIDRIVVYHANDVDRNLLIPCFAALCAREHPLTLEEGLKLGMETTLIIASAREFVRAQKMADGSRTPITPTVAGEELENVIRDLFKIAQLPLDPNSVSEGTAAVSSSGSRRIMNSSGRTPRPLQSQPQPPRPLGQMADMLLRPPTPPAPKDSSPTDTRVVTLPPKRDVVTESAVKGEGGSKVSAQQKKVLKKAAEESARRKAEELAASAKREEEKARVGVEAEAAAKAKADAEAAERERLEQLERERLERLEKERLETLERERVAKLEQDRLANLERERLERLEKERLEALEKERLEKIDREKREQEEIARLEREKQEELESLEREKREQEELARREQEEREQEELARREQEEREQEEFERAKRLEEERIAAEAKRVEDERVAAELEAHRLEQEKREQEELARIDRENQEELARLEKERQEELARLERERQEELARLEKERQEELARLEKERQEELARLERERQEELAREKQEESERAERIETERIAAELEAKRVEDARLAAEEAQRIEDARIAAELEAHRIEQEKREQEELETAKRVEDARLAAIQQEERAQQEAALLVAQNGFAKADKPISDPVKENVDSLTDPPTEPKDPKLTASQIDEIHLAGETAPAPATLQESVNSAGLAPESATQVEDNQPLDPIVEPAKDGDDIKPTEAVTVPAHDSEAVKSTDAVPESVKEGEDTKLTKNQKKKKNKKKNKGTKLDDDEKGSTQGGSTPLVKSANLIDLDEVQTPIDPPPFLQVEKIAQTPPVFSPTPIPTHLFGDPEPPAKEPKGKKPAPAPIPDSDLSDAYQSAQSGPSTPTPEQQAAKAAPGFPKSSDMPTNDPSRSMNQAQPFPSQNGGPWTGNNKPTSPGRSNTPTPRAARNSIQERLAGTAAKVAKGLNSGPKEQKKEGGWGPSWFNSFNA